MKKYKAKDIDRANFWMVKALDTLDEAKVLAKEGKTRLGTYNRLYYSAHHVAQSLLKLIGEGSSSHDGIKKNFSKKWIKEKKFPKTYGKLLKKLSALRIDADYGEYVVSEENSLQSYIIRVEKFINRARKEIPVLSIAEILDLIAKENEEVKDFSFDFYCPKTYFHHTRFTVWCPKGRISSAWIANIISGLKQSLKRIGVAEYSDYVLGVNSRFNQYESKQVVMLDFDNVSTVPFHLLKKEPGFYFRTSNGFHFLGSKLYGMKEWEKKMRKYSRIASIEHYEISMKRNYSTLRLTSSSRKPFVPIYIGRGR